MSHYHTHPAGSGDDHSHSHSHDDSHGDHGHDHDGHDHDKPLDSTPGSLHAQVDFPNVIAFNNSPASPGRAVIKPPSQKEDEEAYIESDADDQLILHVPFTANVKLRSIMIKTGPTDFTAEKVLLFPNDDNLDFNDVQEKKPAQELDLAQVREAVEYPVRPAKFSSCRSVTLFFPSSVGGETTRIYYVGFYGEWTPLVDSPVVTVYEARANPADHPKIPGTEQGLDFRQNQF